MSVTAEQVREIINVPATEVSDLAPFITAAEAIVSAQCSGLTASTEDLVTLWLSAHFLAIRTPRAQNEKAGPVSQSLFGKVDLGLNVTRYGQQAMMLDSSGGLARWNKTVNEGGRSTVTFSWLGTDEDPSCRS